LLGFIRTAGAGRTVGSGLGLVTKPSSLLGGGGGGRTIGSSKTVGVFFLGMGTSGLVVDVAVGIIRDSDRVPRLMM
jgi:hypothetical protein